jgi:hypothetical protein
MDALVIVSPLRVAMELCKPGLMNVTMEILPTQIRA